MKINWPNSAVQRCIRSSRTLRVALEIYLRELARDNKSDTYSIAIGNHSIRLCRLQSVHAQNAKTTYTDLDFFIDIRNIISEYVSHNWFPQYIGFQFPPRFGKIESVIFPDTRLIFGQPNSWLELPRRYLTLSRLNHDISGYMVPARRARRETTAKETANFIYALKRIMIEESDGNLGIDSAANHMCTSVRSLQRHLAQAGLTYSKLLEYARFEVATEMLGDPNLKIIDIAYSLGYEDPSHFSRAFRRVSGQSPREYRMVRLNKLETV
jgi:AraC-like DNA-binding protein